MQPNLSQNTVVSWPYEHSHHCSTASFLLYGCIKQSHNMLLLIHRPSSGQFGVFLIGGAMKMISPDTAKSEPKSVVPWPYGPSHNRWTASFPLYGCIKQSHNVLLLIHRPSSGQFGVQ
jgi:hypothetical protein